ncbi:hypothetical protein ANTPLA_LOCUS1718 [Anthophora plagiata]
MSKMLNKSNAYTIYTDRNKVAGNIIIKFCWIPSHIGIQGNEDVDRLAKLTIETPINEILTVPYTDLLEDFRKSASSETKSIVEQQGFSKAKGYFLNFHCDKPVPCPLRNYKLRI